jgi:hemerythrin-like domain-containing protein
MSELGCRSTTIACGSRSAETDKRKDFPMKTSAWIPSQTRRNFVRLIPVTGAVALAATQVSCGKDEEDELVSTNEDLMREHGVLKRVLLAYDEITTRIRQNRDFSPQSVTDGATIIRKFIEDYHEKLEENYLFPRLRQAGKLAELVDVLLSQHQAGRCLTDRILATAASLKTGEDRNRLANDLKAFNRMYAPHEAREDTVLFPELHKIMSSHEYDSLGEQFEKIERQTFGGDGFDIYVDKVNALEKQLGISDLSQFTPKCA